MIQYLLIIEDIERQTEKIFWSIYWEYLEVKEEKYGYPIKS